MNSLFKIGLFIALLSFCSSGAFSANTEKACLELTFRSEVRLAPGRILLSDIADLEEERGCGVLEQIKNIELGKASSKPGQVRLLNSHTVLKRFIKPVASLENIKVMSPGVVRVTTRFKEVYRDSLKKLLEEEVWKKIQNTKETEYQVHWKRTPKKLTLPESGGKIQVHFNPNFKDKGTQVAYVKVLQGSKVLSRASVPFEIKKWEYVLTASKPLQKGTLIQKGDLVREKVETTRIRNDLLYTEERFLNYRLRRSVSRGKIMKSAHLEAPFAVQEGQNIRVYTSIGEGEISVIARARQNGRSGQIIQLVNLTSKKRIQAKIDENGKLWAIN